MFVPFSVVFVTKRKEWPWKLSPPCWNLPVMTSFNVLQTGPITRWIAVTSHLPCPRDLIHAMDVLEATFPTPWSASAAASWWGAVHSLDAGPTRPGLILATISHETVGLAPKWVPCPGLPSTYILQLSPTTMLTWRTQQTFRCYNAMASLGFSTNPRFISVGDASAFYKPVESPNLTTSVPPRTKTKLC